MPLPPPSRAPPVPRFRSELTFLSPQGTAGSGRRRRPLRALQVGARYAAAADCSVALLSVVVVVGAAAVKTQSFQVLL